MKKYLALSLVVILIFSLCACSVNKDPDETSHGPWEFTEQTEVQGVYFKVNGDKHLIITETGEPILFSIGSWNNGKEELKDGDFIVFTCDSIMESYPAVATAQLLAHSQYPTSTTSVKETLEKLKEIGHTIDEASYIEWTTVKEDPVIEKLQENYEAIAKVVDFLDDGSNIVYSPLSLNFALALVSEGASESVRTDFENYFGTSFEKYLQFYREYINGLTDTVEVANAFWVKEGYTLNKNFHDSILRDFQADSQSLTFDKDFVDMVNNWCAEKTHNMIQGILSEPPESNAIAINALYFKGLWADEYEDAQIAKKNFNLLDKTTIQTDFLMSREHLYLENDQATGFIKYYDGERYAFVGILPKAEGNFKLSDLDLKSLLDSVSRQKVSAWIPEFEFESTNQLTKVVSQIGLESTMSDNDPFPNIIHEQALKIANILQKAKIKLDRKGTEAAAVTIIDMETTAIGPSVEVVKDVHLDRPFAFMLYDTQTETVLFVGKVVNPTNH